MKYKSDSVKNNNSVNAKKSKHQPFFHFTCINKPHGTHNATGPSAKCTQSPMNRRAAHAVGNDAMPHYISSSAITLTCREIALMNVHLCQVLEMNRLCLNTRQIQTGSARCDHHQPISLNMVPYP